MKKEQVSSDEAKDKSLSIHNPTNLLQIARVF